MIGREQFGLLAYGIALGMYGQTIVRYGMDRTLVRDLIHYPERFSQLVIASLLLRAILLLLVATALLAWKIIWEPGDLTWSVIMVIMAYSLKSLDLQPVYDAWHRMARHAAYNAIQRGLYLMLIWAVVFFVPLRLGLLWVGIALLATEVFYLYVQQRWVFQRGSFTTGKSDVGSAIWELGKNNAWMWLTAMGILSFGTLNQIVLKHYSGSVALGGYAASWQLVAAAGLLLGQVARVGNPTTARLTRVGNNGSYRRTFLLKYSIIMALTAVPFALPAVLFPHWILKVVFNPEFISSAPALRLLGLYIIVFSQGLVAAQYIVSARMEKTYCASVVAGGVLSVALCVLLIPKMGGLGAALALLIAHGITMGLYWIAVILHVRKQR